jgi:membrane protein DedA with SNARE-associated domain
MTSFLLQTILSYLLLYKYAALFAVTFLAALVLPLPSSPTLMAAAAFAGQGYFNIGWVFVTALLGNIAGDNAGYWLARRYGKAVLSRIGFRKILESPTFGWIESEIGQYRGAVIITSRANVISTISVNIIAGLSAMPYRYFLRYVIIGETLEVLVYTGIGFFFGTSWETIYGLFGKFTLVVVLLAALGVTLLSRRLQKRFIGRREEYLQSKKSSR